MIKIPNVTVLAISSILIPETILAIEKTCEFIEFGSVKLISHIKPDTLSNDIEFAKCEEIKDIMDYNKLVFSELGQYVQTSHALLIQHHAFVINWSCWQDEFLNFSYIGAPWPIKENSYMGNNGERIRVGNGGFSLRDKKLMNASKELGLPLKQEQGYFNEDGNSTAYYRRELLDYGIKYAPVELAARFSFENPVEENNWGKMKTFGFHRNLPQQKSVFENVTYFN
jgi:hypothetical protein